jgi:hypothetical protein
VQAPLGIGPVGGTRSQAPHHLAPRPLRGQILVVRPGRFPAPDDREPPSRPPSPRPRGHRQSPPAQGPGHRPGRSPEGDHCRRARPVPRRLPLQANRPGQAHPVGTHLGLAARGRQDRQAPRDRRPPEVHVRRLRQAVLLASPRQARRPQGTLHQLPQRQPRQRLRLPPHRLGRLGPQGPGHGPDHPDRRPQLNRRLGHTPPNPAPGWPSGTNALAPPVAQRDDGSRPVLCRRLRRLPHIPARTTQPYGRRSPHLASTSTQTRSKVVNLP